MKTAATSPCPRNGGWRQVAQNMPETDESATDFVLGGDTRLVELREALARAEAATTSMDNADRHGDRARLHSDLADAGEHDAVPRAQALILGLGFKAARARASRSTASPAAGACGCSWRAR